MAEPAPRFAAEMQSMLRDIAWETAQSRSWLGKEALDPRVRAAMAEVPRHAFVPACELSAAYADMPLPIGHGQTISQPFIVALMSDLLATSPEHAVLEVGCGCGYQSAILSRLVRRVYALEIVPDLAREAEARLREGGFANVEVRHGDGYLGWPEHAPFDGIVVTAAAPHIPPPLLRQLKRGGRMVIPVGLPYSHQELLLVVKGENGTADVRNVLPVAFVPLTGGHGSDA